jgi:predicted DCC family thiol-disulfide oxidoreductase YuxK
MATMTDPSLPEILGPVVLFDGVCNLCNGTVAFAIARDSASRLRFAVCQSEAGQALLRRFGLPLREFESFVLIEGDRAYVKSEAFLRLVTYLRRPWPSLAALRLVPASVRDFVYDRIARNRYRIFGRRTVCMVPTPDIAARFLT